MRRRHPDRGSFDFYQSPAMFPQTRPVGLSSDWRKDVDCAFSAPEGFSPSRLPLWPPHAPAPRALPMPQDRGFDRGRAERCELAHDRQIPPTRCSSGGAGAPSARIGAGL